MNQTNILLGESITTVRKRAACQDATKN